MVLHSVVLRLCLRHNYGCATGLFGHFRFPAPLCQMPHSPVCTTLWRAALSVCTTLWHAAFSVSHHLVTCRTLSLHHFVTCLSVSLHQSVTRRILSFAPLCDMPHSQFAPLCDTPHSQFAPLSDTPHSQFAPLSDTPHSQFAPLSDTPHSQHAITVHSCQIVLLSQTEPQHELLCQSTVPVCLPLHINLSPNIFWLSLVPSVACHPCYKFYLIPRNKKPG